MNKQRSFTNHVVATLALAGGMLCLASNVHANESTTYAPDTVDREFLLSGPEAGRIGSMAGTGTKPSKAELAKQQAQQGGTTIASQTAGRSTPAGAGQMSDADRQFLLMAAKDGMKEVHMSQMAVQQGQSPEVKKLGQMIAADHTKANQQLMAIAAKKGIKPDTRATEHGMSKRDMKNFDQAWIGMMVNDHQKDIAAYQRASQQGGDPEVRAFAKKTLPVLQKHLKAVQAAQKKMGSGGTNPAGMDTSAGATTNAGR